MDGNKKIITIAIVALVIGAAIGVAIGFLVKPTEKIDTDDTYNFYLYFGDNDSKNGWYSAKASNAGDGFKNAMDKAGLTYEMSSYGYISKINGKSMDYSAEYLWSTYDRTAATMSKEEYGGVYNGWRDCCGYDGGEYNGCRIAQSNSTTFIISYYVAPAYTHIMIDDPTFFTAWSTGTGTPFATA